RWISGSKEALGSRSCKAALEAAFTGVSNLHFVHRAPHFDGIGNRVTPERVSVGSNSTLSATLRPASDLDFRSSRWDSNWLLLLRATPCQPTRSGCRSFSQASVDACRRSAKGLQNTVVMLLARGTVT